MKTHWKKKVKTNYLGSWDLDGKDLVLTIKSIIMENVKNSDGSNQECIVAHFADADVKPMILNRTNCKAISKVCGSAFVEDWPGVKISVYSARVKSFGETVDGLRIREFAPKGKEKLTDERYNKMVEQIKAGKFSREKALNDFDLSQFQKDMLP
jgi:hypothetical protein